MKKAMQITQTLRFALIFAVIFCAISPEIWADGWTRKKGELWTKLYIGSMSGASYFDANGKRISDLNDQLVNQRYTFDFSGAVGGLNAEYGLLDNCTLTAAIPYGSYSLIEKFLTDSLGNRYIRSEQTRALISWISLGARYRLLNTSWAVLCIAGEIRLPPLQSAPLDTLQAFLGGGSREGVLGVELGIPFQESWLGFSAKYALRQAAWNNMLYLHAEAGFSSVENTSIKFFADYTSAQGSWNTVPAFDIRRLQPAETFLSAGATFTVFPADDYFFDASYSLRLDGRNTWLTGVVCLGGGITF